MRINEGLQSGTRIDGQHEVDSAPRAPASAGQSTSVAPQDGGNYASAPELARLVDAVRQTEDVRPGVVGDVSRRLASGVYDTREAAQRTAEAILNAPH